MSPPSARRRSASRSKSPKRSRSRSRSPPDDTLTASELRQRSRNRRIQRIMKEYGMSRADAEKFDAAPARVEGSYWDYARINQARLAQQLELDRMRARVER
jgi:hypothetical protein